MRAFSGPRFGRLLAAVAFCYASSAWGGFSDQHQYLSDAQSHCQSDSTGAAAAFEAATGSSWTGVALGCAHNEVSKVYHCTFQRYYDGTPQSVMGCCQSGNNSNCLTPFTSTHYYTEILPPPVECDEEPTMQAIYYTLEPWDVCLPSGCWYEATTGSCDQLGTCVFNMEPTGSECEYGTDTPPDPNVPPNCIVGADGGLVCDCSVTPDAAYCQDPDLPDQDIPPNCARNESTGVMVCYTDPDAPDGPSPDCVVDQSRNVLVCGSNEYPLPGTNPGSGDPDPNDPGTLPAPGPMPGDTDGDGVCEPGEPCGQIIGPGGTPVDDTAQQASNTLLQKILDALIRPELGGTLETGAEKQARAKAQFDTEAARVPEKMRQDGGETGLDSGLKGLGDEAGSTIGGVIHGGGTCPVIAVPMGNGSTWSPDVETVVPAIRGINGFLMWFFVAWAVYSGGLAVFRNR